MPKLNWISVNHGKLWSKYLFWQVFVANKKRFFKEYSLEPGEDVKKGKKPGTIVKILSFGADRSEQTVQFQGLHCLNLVFE